MWSLNSKAIRKYLIESIIKDILNIFACPKCHTY
jgi:hypothetical protein